MCCNGGVGGGVVMVAIGVGVMVYTKDRNTSNVLVIWQWATIRCAHTNKKNN